MAKMREFLFWNESGQEEKKENTSFKKAVKSIQEKFKKPQFKVGDRVKYEFLGDNGWGYITKIQNQIRYRCMSLPAILVIMLILCWRRQ